MEDKTIKVADRFVNFLKDWDYETYLLLGGYGSGKSWHVALKIILKCMEEKRKVLVCRAVFDTIRESCFALFKDILSNLDLLADENDRTDKSKYGKIVATNSPMQIKFPNGSRIIFRGLDDAVKVKSIHGVSIVWLEEASEIKYEAYKELQGRVREYGISLHFFLSLNPVGKENWTYSHFFKRVDDEGNCTTILDEEKLYKKKTVISNGVYYHHSLPEDNPFLPISYIKRLDSLMVYDFQLYTVAKLGRFGANGTRVLPQFEVADSVEYVLDKVKELSRKDRYIGMDFGFEESYNAVVKVAVDIKSKTLYIYDEIYINHVTDDKMANLPEMQKIKEREELITADSAEPKTIQYYRQQGFKMRPCKKFAGSRLANTRKVKRFEHIVCSPKCRNTIRELKELVYSKDSKGNAIYDEFNIDPHTFSAIWYALDSVTVADIKEIKSNSIAG